MTVLSTVSSVFRVYVLDFVPADKRSGGERREMGRRERGNAKMDVLAKPVNPIFDGCCPFPPAVNSISICWTSSSSSSSDSESITIVFCGCPCGGG
jgi:hypothetical protein